MTEAEWLAATDVTAMLRWLAVTRRVPRRSTRRLQLFAVHPFNQPPRNHHPRMHHSHHRQHRPRRIHHPNLVRVSVPFSARPRLRRRSLSSDRP